MHKRSIETSNWALNWCPQVSQSQDTAWYFRSTYWQASQNFLKTCNREKTLKIPAHPQLLLRTKHIHRDWLIDWAVDGPIGTICILKTLPRSPPTTPPVRIYSSSSSPQYMLRHGRYLEKLDIPAEYSARTNLCWVLCKANRKVLPAEPCPRCFTNLSEWTISRIEFFTGSGQARWSDLQLSGWGEEPRHVVVVCLLNYSHLWELDGNFIGEINTIHTEDE